MGPSAGAKLESRQAQASGAASPGVAPYGPARVLVVDDDPDIRAMVVRLLEADGYKVDEATRGEEAIAALRNGRRPDLVILDVMLAYENGFDVLTSIRRCSDVPVILVTARADETDRVLGLKIGADDYVVKPFSPPELAARVGTVLRRATHRPVDEPTTLDFDDLRIDTRTREVWLADSLIETTAKEFALLAFLAASPRQVFTRDQLLEQVWESSSAWQDVGTVTEHVRRVRRKIEADPDRPRWLRTVRGVGYRFEP